MCAPNRNRKLQKPVYIAYLLIKGYKNKALEIGVLQIPDNAIISVCVRPLEENMALRLSKLKSERGRCR